MRVTYSAGLAGSRQRLALRRVTSMRDFRRRQPMDRGRIFALATFAVAGLAVVGPSHGATAQQSPPSWAYPVNLPVVQPAANDKALHSVPGSAATFSLAQLRDFFDVPDWHPEDHPPMPSAVSHGRKPDVLACGFCHLPRASHVVASRQHSKHRYFVHGQ